MSNTLWKISVGKWVYFHTKKGLSNTAKMSPCICTDPANNNNNSNLEHKKLYKCATVLISYMQIHFACMVSIYIVKCDLFMNYFHTPPSIGPIFCISPQWYGIHRVLAYQQYRIYGCRIPY